MLRQLRILLIPLAFALALPILGSQPASAGRSVAGGTVAGGTVAGGTTNERGKAAAGWLAGQLKNGTHLQSCFGGQCFPDYGLTADAVIGMASTKSAGKAISRATGWLAGHAGAYIGATDGTGPYPGSYAKLALTAEVTGRAPTSFGGVDLLARLRALQCPHVGCTSGQRGEFRNARKDGGYPNVITQSLAIVALSRSTRAADRAAVPAAVRFLKQQQCSPTSGYPTFFPVGGACAAEVDATAFAVQALLSAHSRPAGAVGWLAAQQRRNGGFAGNGTVNANSTGLAIQALSAAGRPTAAAQKYLARLQLRCSAAPANRGAISYDGVATYKAATAQRATPQGIFGFTRVPLAKVSAAGARPAALRLTCAR